VEILFYLEWLATFGALAFLLPVLNFIRKRRGAICLQVFLLKLAIVTLLAVPYAIYKAWKKSSDTK
jgi:hypothetical protein